MKYVLVGTAKNEGPYIWEWVAHHRAIGFTDIILFQNDSDDFTHQIMRTLRAAGAIEYSYNKAAPGRHQACAYTRASRHPRFAEADCAMAVDLDEFLTIKVGEGRLDDLTYAMPPCDSILINWKLFGCSGHSELIDDLVTERFTRTQEPTPVRNRLHGYKTLFRTDAFNRCGIHQLRERKKPEAKLRRFNGSGMGEGEFVLRNWRSTDPSERHFAQINHYSVRDVASFMLKSVRGSAHQNTRVIGSKYWSDQNRNESTDLLLAEQSARTKNAMRELDGKVGGRLGVLRARAIRLHRKRLAELLKDDTNRELYEKYCSE